MPAPPAAAGHLPVPGLALVDVQSCFMLRGAPQTDGDELDGRQANGLFYVDGHHA
jgi:hypothetical protein